MTWLAIWLYVWGGIAVVSAEIGADEKFSWWGIIGWPIFVPIVAINATVDHVRKRRASR